MSSPATLKYPPILGLSPVSQDFVLKLSALYNKSLVFFMLFCFLAKPVASPCSCTSCAASPFFILSLYHHWLVDSILMDNYEILEPNRAEVRFTVLLWQYEGEK